MKTCRYHCACCDAHFTSLMGFDAHRRNGACRLKPVTTRKGVQWAELEGICNLTKGRIGQRVPCLVWCDPSKDTRFNKSSLNALSDSKPLEGTSKVIPHLDSESPSEDARQRSQRMDEVLTTHPLDTEGEERYASGSYRQVCRRCHRPITRTGLRGRPPTHHKECEECT